MIPGASVSLTAFGPEAPVSRGRLVINHWLSVYVITRQQLIPLLQHITSCVYSSSYALRPQAARASRTVSAHRRRSRSWMDFFCFWKQRRGRMTSLKQCRVFTSSHLRSLLVVAGRAPQAYHRSALYLPTSAVPAARAISLISAEIILNFVVKVSISC